MIARLASGPVLLLLATLAASPSPAGAAEPSYEDRLLRLAEILGAIHHLRDICGADEGQLWREQMVALLEAEDPPSQYRARLIATFNNSYRGFQRTYGTCTTSAKQAIERFFTEGSQLTASLSITLESQSLAPDGDGDPEQSGDDETADRPAEDTPAQ